MATVKSGPKKVRYAVVGAGYISQVAMMPAFAHAKNSELTAIVSGDPVKLKALQKKYKVPYLYSYEQYEKCLRSGNIDAVYIALPNNMHRAYAQQAAKAGIHVLCEKPMAVTVSECEKMMRDAQANNVKLMIAYRLHFDEANLKAVEIARSGKLGDVRIFSSAFTMQVKEGDIRVQKRLGGGTLYDIGIYCINAARYLFDAEPLEVTAFSANNGEKRFREVDEMTGAVLKFPEERLAVFTTSFGTMSNANYTLIGTEGKLTLVDGYEYSVPREMTIETESGKKTLKFPKRDQFAPELVYFSKCILENKQPEPSGQEGLADVRIIQALYKAAETGRSIKIRPVQRRQRPRMKQEIYRPPIEKPELIHAASPHPQ